MNRVSPDQARAINVLDVQQDIAHWWETTQGQTYARGFMRDLTERRHSAPPIEGDLAGALAYDMRRAETFFITAEMVDVIARLVETLPPPDEPDATYDLAPPDLFPCGVLFLAKPFVILDRRGMPMAITALVWTVDQRRTQHPDLSLGMMAAYSDITSGLDSWREDIGEQYDYDRVLSLMGDKAQHMLCHCGPLPAPAAFARWPADWVGEGDKRDPGTVWEALPEMAFLVAAWNMLRSRIAGPTLVTADRPRRRRWERAGMTGPAEVTVIDLRKRDTPTDGHAAPGGTSPAWSHRWLVRPHYRWQPYGPGRTRRRLVLIEGYVKGPADAPLVVKDTLYRLKR